MVTAKDVFEMCAYIKPYKMVVTFYHCCQKVPGKTRKVYFDSHFEGTAIMAEEVWRRGCEAAGYLASEIRKRGGVSADAQLAFFF